MNIQQTGISAMKTTSAQGAIKIGNLRWMWISWLVFIVDQSAKWLAIRYLYFGEPVEVTPFLNWTLDYNYGAAFGFLNKSGGWQRWFFILIAVVVCAVIVAWLMKLPRKNNFQAFALSLILGGALGNLWDRIFHSYVIDFIYFHIAAWHFAIFNLADAAVTIGAILFALTFFSKEDHTI